MPSKRDMEDTIYDLLRHASEEAQLTYDLDDDEQDQLFNALLDALDLWKVK